MIRPGKRAVLVTQVPTVGDTAKWARLRQIIGLYAGLGLETDAVFLTPRSSDLEALDLIDGLGRIAVLPETEPGSAPNPDDPSQTEKIHQALAVLEHTHQDIDLVHVLALDVPRPEYPVSARWIFDASDTWQHDRAPDGTDLALAAEESLRATIEADHPVVRWPFTAPGLAAAGGPMLGWVGPFDAAAQARWTEVLALLAGWGHRLPGGLLLAGPGAQGIAVPRLFGGVTVQTEAVSKGAQRALGLGVLLAESMAGQCNGLAAILMQRTPVFAGSMMLQSAEDRWHLPVFDSAPDLAAALAEWAESGPGADLRTATEATQSAFAYDQAAMDRHVAAVLAAALPDQTIA